MVIMVILYILGMIVNLLACIYFFCSNDFKKLLYYIVVVFNIIIALVQTFGGEGPLLKS